MLAARLLMAAGSGGGFGQPVGTFGITAPNAGGWTEVAGPHAARDADRTYIAWVGGNSKPNDVEVVAWNHSTGALDGPILLHDHLTTGASTDPDSHNGPAVLVRPDGYIVVAYCGHQETFMRTKVSNAPDDITAGFTSPSSFSHTGVTWTYPQLAYLSGSDKVYVSMRGHITSGDIGDWWLNSSSDGGTTWGSEVEIYRPGTGASLVYAASCSNGVDRIDWVVTDYAPDHVGGYGLWHFYMDDAGTFRKSDGTSIGGGTPFDQTDLTQIVASGGDAYPYSIGYTGDGRPVIACQSKQADPVEIFEYRWSGSAWERNDIATSDPIGPSILSVGGGCHVWTDSERFITSRMDGGGTGLGHLIVSEYRSADDGATWSHYADYGSGSSPVYVRDGDGIVALWFAPASSFTGSHDFDPGLAGIA